MSEKYRLYGSLIFFIGCGETNYSAGDVSDTAAFDDAIDGGGDSAVSSGEGLDAAWWNLSANLHFENGNLSLEKSSFSAEILQEDRQEICTVLGGPVSAEFLDDPPHDTIDHWWSFNLDSWDSSCDGVVSVETMPLEFQMGLGEMHPEILAVLDNLPQAENGSEDTLSSAFASFDSGKSLLVFGAGGTSDDFSGVSGKDKYGDGFNGTYFIYPLYPFEFPVD